jgi:hypothetical protein
MCLERADVLAAKMPDKAPILVLNGPFDNPRVVVVALALPNQTRALGETLDCKMAKRKLAINGPLCFQQFEGKFFRHLLDLKPVSPARLLYAKRLAQGKGSIIPDDAKTNTAAMSAWIDTNRVKKRRKLDRKTSNRPVVSVAPQGVPPKRSRKQKVVTDAASMAPAPTNSNRTPLRIPYGNKEVALKARCPLWLRGWYAPPGVDLSAFGERGWLL